MLIMRLQAMTESFRAELQKFDRERVLPAWDGLVTKQQAALEALGVPAMFPTTLATDREVRMAPPGHYPHHCLRFLRFSIFQFDKNRG